MIGPAACFTRNCMFYKGVEKPDGTEQSEQHVCHAYLNGIPENIIAGTDLHLEVRDDQDNDIVFEKNEQ